MISMEENKTMSNNNWPIDSLKLRHIPKDELFICMFSGAKIVA